MEELGDNVLTSADGAAGMCLAPVQPGSTAAWLRWAAVRDGAPVSRLLGELLDAHIERLHPLGARALWCVCVRGSWLTRPLRDNAFAKVDEIVTLEHRQRAGKQAAPRHVPGLVLRDCAVSDLPVLARIDHDAFEMQWRYPEAVLHRVHERVRVFTVGELDGRPVAYQCATLDEGHAHIIRLVVAPQVARRGIGRALLLDALERLAALSAGRITLNTPASLPAIELYRQVGFRPLLDVADVFYREI